MSFINTVRERLREYPAYYEAPTGAYARYDQNANLVGPNPAAAGLGADDLNLYPSRDNRPLLEAAAGVFEVSWQNVWPGNGSDEILDHVLRLFVEPGGSVASPWPSYALYPHLCRLNRIDWRPVPMGEGFKLPVDVLVERGADLLLVANPNNPTGTAYPEADLQRLVDAFEGPVVIDEAYAEFAGRTSLPLLRKRDNLIVVRTLSKAYGLAGLRVGLGVASSEVAELVRRAKTPFTVGLPAERAAIAALQSPAHVATTVETIARERERLASALQEMGFDVAPSDANFLLTRPPIPSLRLYEELKRRSILTRVFPLEPMIADRIRFTVGTASDTDRLVSTLRAILTEAIA